MTDLPETVGVLVADEPTPEQRAAFDWLTDAGTGVERKRLSAIAAGDADLDDCDVLWWHADESVADDPTLERAADPIRAYVDAGGGLLLSLRAQEAVPAL